jgi:tRNA U34 5-methylaminomethyl-2-thiouridine-forming methyltransferase MnmC
MSKRIYITHANDVSADEAVQTVASAFKMVPKDQRVGVITFTNGLALSFNEAAKNPSMYVWRETP